jgi:putative pyoverdin transport system ATP-binding/permease protein
VKNPIWELLKSETEASMGTILFMSMLAGLAQTVSILIVNTAAVNFINSSEMDTRLFFLFIITIVLFLFTQRYVLRQSVDIVETSMARIRVRIINKIRRLELGYAEGKNRGEIYMNLTQDGNLISYSGMIVALSLQSTIVALFCFIYIAWLSPLAFLVLLSLTVVFSLLFVFQSKTIHKDLSHANKQESAFFGLLNHMLSGFKELKLNDLKNDDLFSHIKDISHEAKRSKIRVGNKFVFQFLAKYLGLAVLLAAVVFILPPFNQGHAEIIISITAVVLFVSGHLDMALNAFPNLIRVNVAVENIQRLERELDRAQSPGEVMAFEDIESPYDFRELEFVDMEFVYRDDRGYPLYSFGPTSLKLKRGEILFVVGENGSGKTTLLKLLSGLYFPHRGSLHVDGQALNIQDYPRYRELFATVFADYHLFDRLYGVDEVDERDVNDWLERLRLSGKTRFLNGAFSTVALSTGQRKRLAFIASLLEDRPVYIFDELAADQDPEFQSVFYEEVLPELKRRGKTIIAVSHDDRFWHVADRVVRFVYGKQDGEIDVSPI